MSAEYSEDIFVQVTTANTLQTLGWEVVYAFDRETLGSAGTLGRVSHSEVVLTRYLHAKLVEFNPGLPPSAYTAAIDQLSAASAAKSILQHNQEFYTLLRDGVPVAVRHPNGKERIERLRVFDFDTAANNHFLIVRELWVQGRTYLRRPDLIGFVNGLPLLFIELKAHYRDVRVAFDTNLRDYKAAIPHLFHHNAIILLANDHEGRIGSLTSQYRHFNQWPRLSEEEAGAVDWETMLRGVCRPANFLDLFENFILFDNSGKETVKIIARNHQYLGVNRAFAAVEERQLRAGKLGVFWHTQGSGKSYSMALLARKIHRKLPGNFTFLILTDRQELERQIYKTFAGVGAAIGEGIVAANGAHLKKLLQENHAYLFSLIHKFNQTDDEPYSPRNDIIVFSDEAHRTQYGRLAQTMRAMLPNAAYLGFTGTPLIGGPEDAQTREVFGDYISVYDFKRSVDDRATVPLYYDNRGKKLTITTDAINQQVEAILADAALEEDIETRVRHALGDKYMVFIADTRLGPIAADLVTHYTTRWQTGKAMLVCLDKIAAVKMYDHIHQQWQAAIAAQRAIVKQAEDEQAAREAADKLAWLEATQVRVIVSEEAGEAATFAEWGLDIEIHRKRMRDNDLESHFKDAAHPFRLAIVCAMWLTGFDVESLATLYIDKPMQSHTLMQAIARANRVAEGKPNGLIVDYNGILQSLRRALATYAGWQAQGTQPPGPSPAAVDPVKSPAERLAEYVAALDACVAYIAACGYTLADLINAQGFQKSAALAAAVNAVSANDRTIAEFDVRAANLFSLHKALIDRTPELAPYRPPFNAIEAIHRRLHPVTEPPQINAILAQIHQQVSGAITIVEERVPYETDRLFDISQIDFDRLRAEFARVATKNTIVHDLKTQIERRLNRMVAQNPSRLDLYNRYRAIITQYNNETDRVTIEQTFDALLNLMQRMSTEETRAVREGLSEEHLAIFDLLCQEKPALTPPVRNRIKGVAATLLTAIKARITQIDHWTAKEATRDQIATLIRDFLWDEQRGLPDPEYTMEEIPKLATKVYQHVYQQYRFPTEPPYEQAA